MTDPEDEAARLAELTAAGRQAKADKDVVLNLLSTPDGRYWVERVLEFCDIYNAENASADVLFIRLGRKQVGLHLLSMIELHASDAYLRMIRERQARLVILAAKKEEDERKQRQRDAGYGANGVPGVTDLEEMADQQARNLAPKATKGN